MSLTKTLDQLEQLIAAGELETAQHLIQTQMAHLADQGDSIANLQAAKHRIEQLTPRVQQARAEIANRLRGLRKGAKVREKYIACA